MAGCGCDVRRETIGEQNFWNGVLFTGSAVLLLIARGGTVSSQTRKLVSIGLAGAIVAIVSDQVIRPNVKL